ncbi:hypothetical protein DFJ58DRAFT_730358 [Suillus subalutaceus]|uniref:uncharacterized protein n=1 Tax=Suillus subalutaceus TaxID=48586 RepID=UPI001B861B4F|nr:uncharacterized protein DFJ58DRAFT_730358 [Suillus subalutaceus]KAG1847029.1 hypothetical protein DFJ58DRAFT_730358 [Suillus subalutaceus]
MYLPAHETTFIVGSSGSGKSTLGAILMRGLQSNLWLAGVAQGAASALVFHGSLHENVALATVGRGKRTEDVTRGEVEEACRVAMLESWVTDLDQGYERHWCRRHSVDDITLPSNRHRSLSSCICTGLIAISTAVITVVIFASVFNACNNLLDPNVRERICKKWDIELRHHEEDVLKHADTKQQWGLEDKERICLRQQWEREAEEHKREVEQRQRCEEEERLRLNMFCTSYDTQEYTA